MMMRMPRLERSSPGQHVTELTAGFPIGFAHVGAPEATNAFDALEDVLAFLLADRLREADRAYGRPRREERLSMTHR